MEEILLKYNSRSRQEKSLYESTSEKSVNKEPFPSLLPPLLLNHGDDYSIFQRDGLKEGKLWPIWGRKIPLGMGRKIILLLFNTRLHGLSNLKFTTGGIMKSQALDWN